MAALLLSHPFIHVTVLHVTSDLRLCRIMTVSLTLDWRSWGKIQVEKKFLHTFHACFFLHWKEVGAELSDDNPTPALSLRLRIQIYVTESVGEIWGRWVKSSSIGLVLRRKGAILDELKFAAEVSLRQGESCDAGQEAQLSWLVEVESENSTATK